MKRKILLLTILFTIVGITLFVPSFRAQGDDDTENRTELVLKHFNRGVSLMERFQPVEAIAEFRAVVKLLPEWFAGRWNLSIALLNTSKDEDLEECRKQLMLLGKSHPKSSRVPYALGMLFTHKGDTKAALKQFELAHKNEPMDAHSLYHLGKIAGQSDEKEKAMSLLRRALELQPGLSSAHYQLGMLLIRDKKRKEGRDHLKRFKALEGAGTGIKVNIKYTEMGPLADIIRFGPVPGASSRPPVAREKLKLQAVKVTERKVPSSSDAALGGIQKLAVSLGPKSVLGDFNGDGQTDVFLAACSEDKAADALMLSVKSGGYREAIKDSGIPAGAFTTTAAVGDYDDDGYDDLFVARLGGCHLYRNLGDGTFEDTTAATGLDKIAAALYADAHLVDADQDGDLDLFAAAYAGTSEGTSSGAPDQLFANLGDGRFDERSEVSGLAGSARSRSAVFSDFDGDGSLDLFLAVDGDKNLYYRNKRALRFEERADALGLADPGPAQAAFAGDFNGDDLTDLVLLPGSGAEPVLYRGKRQQPFESITLSSPIPSPGFGGIADLDLDGFLDLTFVNTGQVGVLRNDGRGGFRPVAVDLGGADTTSNDTTLAFDDFDKNGAPDILLVGRESSLTVLKNTVPEGHYWLRLALKGVKRQGSSFSNRKGVGARAEVKAGDRWTVREFGVGGNSNRPVTVGLGPRPKADYIRVRWPDGVLQSEMEISGNQEIEIEEVVRKPSSCPILFTWDGEKFRFITDFLGTGGMGFFLSPGNYPAPDPSEDVRIPPGALVARDGKLEVRLQEPLEEVCYLDQVQLLAVDHPPGTELYPDERFGGHPAPNGRMLVVREKISPKTAVDTDGRDVSELVAAVDRRWPKPRLHSLYTGFCREHWLELGFDARSIKGSGELFLFLDGWVEYTYSHINYAASQAGVELFPPVMEVPDGRGGWRVVRKNAGYPAGLPRTMAMPLPPEAIEAGRLRLRTNMEIYWDRCFFARDESPKQSGSPRVTTLDPSTATLRHFGIPREYSPDGHYPPLYAYDRKESGIFYQNIPGHYTRYGDVRELTLRADDRFVIFGRGEEVTLEFDANAIPTQKDGHKRTYVLRTFGYCKDRSVYTAHSDGVGPLPFRGMSGYPYTPNENYPDDKLHREYRQLWNTRTIHDG